MGSTLFNMACHVNFGYVLLILMVCRLTFANPNEATADFDLINDPSFVLKATAWLAENPSAANFLFGQGRGPVSDYFLRGRRYSDHLLRGRRSYSDHFLRGRRYSDHLLRGR